MTLCVPIFDNAHIWTFKSVELSRNLHMSIWTDFHSRSVLEKQSVLRGSCCCSPASVVSSMPLLKNKLYSWLCSLLINSTSSCNVRAVSTRIQVSSLCSYCYHWAMTTSIKSNNAPLEIRRTITQQNTLNTMKNQSYLWPCCCSCSI
jgi:hypothetical protein